MALEIINPITIVPAVQATAVSIVGFNVNVISGILDIIYQAGNMSTDVTPVFIPIDGTNHNLHLEGASFFAFLQANPTLYPAIKAGLYAQIQQSLNASGTII